MRVTNVLGDGIWAHSVACGFRDVTRPDHNMDCVLWNSLTCVTVSSELWITIPYRWVREINSAKINEICLNGTYVTTNIRNPRD